MKSPFVRRVAVAATVFVLTVVGVLAAITVVDRVQVSRNANAPVQLPESAASVEAMAELPELPAELSVATVALIRERPDVAVIDVRGAAEIGDGGIPGAIWIPLEEIAGRMDEIPGEGVVVAVCRSGRRSGEARDLLRSEGFADVHNMRGGMRAWRHAGHGTTPR